VIAVVVTALEMKHHFRPKDAAERITRSAFRDVVELLVTGLAFGLVGLEIRHVIRDEGNDIRGMLGVAALVCILVFAVRFLWARGAGRGWAEAREPPAAKLCEGGPDPDLVRHAWTGHPGAGIGLAPDAG